MKVFIIVLSVFLLGCNNNNKIILLNIPTSCSSRELDVSNYRSFQLDGGKINGFFPNEFSLFEKDSIKNSVSYNFYDTINEHYETIYFSITDNLDKTINEIKESLVAKQYTDSLYRQPKHILDTVFQHKKYKGSVTEILSKNEIKGRFVYARYVKLYINNRAIRYTYALKTNLDKKDMICSNRKRLESIEFD